MASFPPLPSIHMLPGATCNPHSFSNDGSPDQACACGLAAVIVAQVIPRLSHSQVPASTLATATVRGPASSELSFNWLQIRENLKGSLRSTSTPEPGYDRAALQTRACVLSHQSHSGVAATPAPAELVGATDALAARPGTDHAALQHHSSWNRGTDEDGQGDSDSPSAGSEEPDRRRPRGKGMAGEAQVSLSARPAGAAAVRCRLYTHRPGSSSAWAGSGMCSQVQAGRPQLSKLAALSVRWRQALLA